MRRSSLDRLLISEEQHYAIRGWLLLDTYLAAYPTGGVQETKSTYEIAHGITCPAFLEHFRTKSVRSVYLSPQTRLARVSFHGCIE